MFTFQQFSIEQDRCAMKVGTDGVLLGAWAGVGEQVEGTTESVRRILDIGTGTGLVALMMAQRFPDALVDAVEIDGAAAAQAQENAARSPFASRVSVIPASVQTFAATAKHRYDAIVSNPPYFQNSLKNPDEQRATARHADTLPYQDLLTAASSLLSEGGRLSVVLPVGNSLTDFMEQAVYQGFLLTRQTLIKTTVKKAPKRCLLEFGKHRNGPVVMEEQYLMNAENGRSEWYEELTKNFYLSV